MAEVKRILFKTETADNSIELEIAEVEKNAAVLGVLTNRAGTCAATVKTLRGEALEDFKQFLRDAYSALKLGSYSSSAEQAEEAKRRG
jgi:hypothetical protein